MKFTLIGYRHYSYTSKKTNALVSGTELHLIKHDKNAEDLVGSSVEFLKSKMIERLAPSDIGKKFDIYFDVDRYGNKIIESFKEVTDK